MKVGPILPGGVKEAEVPRNRLLGQKDAFIAKKSLTLLEALSEKSSDRWWSEGLKAELPSLDKGVNAIANQPLFNKLRLLAQKSFIKIVAR